MSTTTTITATAAATTTAPPAITAETILSLFPDIDTSGDALEGHDEEQIRLMDEVCIVVDENDLPIGKGSKKICRSSPVARPTFAGGRCNMRLRARLIREQK